MTSSYEVIKRPIKMFPQQQQQEQQLAPLLDLTTFAAGKKKAYVQYLLSHLFLSLQGELSGV